jgi:hypothetical protein
MDRGSSGFAPILKLARSKSAPGAGLSWSRPGVFAADRLVDSMTEGIQIQVADRGVGVPERLKAKLFKILGSLDASH